MDRVLCAYMYTQIFTYICVQSYVISLDRVLQRKIEAVNKLRMRLQEFQQHLKEEETLSKTCRM
jgi:hypothetical protein